MKLVATVFFLALMALIINGQTAPVKKSTVRGVATIASSKKDIPNAVAKRAFVHFKGAENNKYSIYTDDNGKYKIDLAPGKYAVYAAKNPKCVYCIEYFNNEFVVPEDGAVTLDIVLRFISEG